MNSTQPHENPTPAHAFERFTTLNAGGFAQPRGMYDPAYERDSCGIGFTARLDAKPTHEIVQNAIKILINLEHRGAVGGDKSTGDGAGLLLQIPDAFFREEAKKLKINLPAAHEYGVAMTFLPTDTALREKCQKTIESIAIQEGAEVLGWRDVPTNSSELGHLALSAMPCFKQLFVGMGKIAKPVFERKLYLIRKVAEHTIKAMKEDVSQFYVTSLSSFTINYKGLLTGTQLPTFYPDLVNPAFLSAFGLVHQRFSTNTLPTWPLAQPFRFLAHNGEINTLRGNLNQMRSREALLQSDLFGEDIERLKPIIDESGSDSACFDNCLELLVAAGRSIPHAMMMMIPEAWGQRFLMSEDKRAFYEYHAAMMEPWDGPASISFTDGRRYIGAVLDRNGLRPSRYTLTKDGVIVMASETGVLEIPDEQILKRGRLQPGKMFLVDLEQHRIISDTELKATFSRRKPYRHWVRNNRIELRGLQAPPSVQQVDPETLRRRQHVFGYTDEDLKMLIAPMASSGQEAVGSMGNDAALAVLSEKPQLLFWYFKQLFAQVTNPPIDPLREELVMSLMSFAGRERNLLDETPEHFRRLKLNHPVLTPEDINKLRESKNPDIVASEIDILFPAGGDGAALEKALEEVFAKAEQAIAEGATLLILTDRNMDEQYAPIPSLLATAGLHHHLIRRKLRTAASILVDSGEPREVMHFALLIGYGASGICPRTAFGTIREMAANGLLDGKLTPEKAFDNFIVAIKKGLLKTFSRMGISTIRSYFGSQIFEAVGLKTCLVDKYFTNTASRIEGVGLNEIAAESGARHAKGFPAHHKKVNNLLDSGGHYHIRMDGERHQWTPEAISLLQQSTRANDYGIFKKFTQHVNEVSARHAAIRGLIRFKPATAIPIEEVEPVEAITRRFVTAAMSFGSISKEAHESIAIALNRLGGRSNSGEGGEDPERFIPLPNGDSRRSAIKQVASGRFGVTIEYLVNADELQIKIAQGAKPGEGGQLPGHKVSPDIARVRHTTPGVTLISPPPHHDIYSIEDLAQLIFDLKMSNPRANVSVKLVSEVGVGTVASGVAKAKADLVLISGFDGGTGASPLTSVKHAGLPWELGLAETQQSLVNNHLRDRIRVQVDGQLKTGRDLAIAAMLGAEEYGFGTSILITLGCVMMRKCHLNTCPVGVATQDPRLRDKFNGMPDYVERFLRFLAQDFREQMAALGFRTVDEMIGRVDQLEIEPAVLHWKTKGLDYSKLLAVPANPGNLPLHSIRKQEHTVHLALDQKLIELAKPALEERKPVAIDLPIRNVDRTVGATLSGELTLKQGAKGLPEDTIQFNFKGSAGQSFGAFLAPGITLRVEGDANDYVGKGLSGGKIVVVPPKKSSLVPHENIIAGNVILYGATGGELFLHGIAGERFAIRNSGAKAVVEGLGDHGCEYMTGGCVVVLGSTGYNFAAGMSGGIAYVYDPTELFETRCNLDMVDLESVWNEEDKAQLRGLIEKHLKYTGSPRAKMILDNWDTHFPLFVKVMPVEYRKVLERMRQEASRDSENAAMTEEVFVKA